MIYIIDHQDSFTWNVVHQFSQFDKVYCSNYFEINNSLLNKSNAIVLSPGPGSPKDYPNTSKISLLDEKPIALNNNVAGNFLRRSIIA